MSMADVADREEEFVIAGPRRSTPYTTNVTTTAYEEDYTPPPSGTDSVPEAAPTLEELRIGHSGWHQSLWCVAHRARNEIAGLADIEAPIDDFDCTANQAATEAFSSTLADFISAPQSERPAGDTDDSQRGTFHVHHQREVIFSQQVEFHLQQLPRWKPHIALDRRTTETDDD